MQILRDEEDFACALDSWPDQELVQLLQSRLAFYAEYEEPLADLYKLILVELTSPVSSVHCDVDFGFA